MISVFILYYKEKRLKTFKRVYSELCKVLECLDILLFYDFGQLPLI